MEWEGFFATDLLLLNELHVERLGLVGRLAGGAGWAVVASVTDFRLRAHKGTVHGPSWITGKADLGGVGVRA